MTARILTGTKQEIADAIARMTGEVREVVVYVDDQPAGAEPVSPDVDIFAEMEPYMVQAEGSVDYSRESIYTRQEGE